MHRELEMKCQTSSNLSTDDFREFWPDEHQKIDRLKLQSCQMLKFEAFQVEYIVDPFVDRDDEPNRPKTQLATGLTIHLPKSKK